MNELDFLIMVCKIALEWLRSDDPMLQDPEYAALVPSAIAEYTRQLNELESRKRAEPVTVGLGTARLKSAVPKSGG